jgi:hypothetical protein
METEPGRGRAAADVRYVEASREQVIRLGRLIQSKNPTVVRDVFISPRISPSVVYGSLTPDPASLAGAAQFGREQSLDAGRIPKSIGHLPLGCVQPQRQSKLAALRRGKPVRFLVGTWILVLNVEVE